MEIKELIQSILGKGAQYCDIRKEKWHRTILYLKDGVPETVIQGEEEGAMTRVLCGDGWGYVGTADLSSLERSLERALSMAKNSDKLKKDRTGLAEVEPVQEKAVYPMKDSFLDVSPEEKLEFLQELETHLEGDIVRSTDLRYRDLLVEKEIITSEGTHVTMEIPRLVTYMIVTGKSDTVQMATEAIGGTGGFELSGEAFEKADILLDRLGALLEAKSPPSGKLPLVMDPHLTGVFSHEAFGHAAEGDLVSSGNSCLKGKIGVDTQRYVYLIHETIDHWQHPIDLIFYGYTSTSRPGTFTAYIYYISTFAHHILSSFDGSVQIVVYTTIIEAIRSHVQYPHHPCSFTGNRRVRRIVKIL